MKIVKPKIRIGSAGKGKTKYITDWLKKKKTEDETARVALVVSEQSEKRWVEDNFFLDEDIRIINGSEPEKIQAMEIDIAGIDNLWKFDNPKRIINTLLNRRAEVMCTQDDIFDIDRIYSGDLDENGE